MKVYENLSELYLKFQSEDNSEKVQIPQHVGNGLINYVNMGKFLYRGQDKAYSINKSKKLDINDLKSERIIPNVTPSLLRPDLVKENHDKLYYYLSYILMERLVNHEFLKNQFIKNKTIITKNNIAYYTIPILQHYGFRTTALDVTFNFNVALNFASMIGSDYEDEIKDNDIGVIYRIRTSDIINKTRLMMIPTILNLSRPLRQEAAYLDMISLLQNNKIYYDYNASHIESLFESFYFKHNKLDEFDNWNSKKSLYLMTELEKELIENTFHNIPNEINIINISVNQITQNCSLSANNFILFRINDYNLGDKEITELTRLGNIAQDFDFQNFENEVIKYISNWPKNNFENAITSYLKSLNYKIDEILKNTNMSNNVKKIIIEWKDNMILGKFTRLMNTINKIMLEWRKSYPDYPIISIPDTIIDKIVKSKNKNINYGITKN